MLELNLSIEAYKLLLVFCRVGGTIRFLPALGENIFPMNIKVAFSLTISFLIYPIIGDLLAITNQPTLMLINIIKESFIGIFLGLSIKLTYQALNIAFVYVATLSGLAFATIYDPSQKEQSTILSSIVSIMFIAAVFVSDTHHLFIKMIISSYNLFLPKALINISDFSNLIITILSNCFLIVIKISAPYFLINLAMNICNGIISRLMPSFQVFFVMVPIQVFITFVILYLTIYSSLNIELEEINKVLSNFI